MSGQNQTVLVTSPLGKDALAFHRLIGTEEMGRLFEFEVELFRKYADGPVDATKLLGKGMTVEVEMFTGKPRYINGVVSQFKHTGGVVNRYITYRAVLRPWLWLLTLSTDCKIFQEKSVVDIIQAVFADYSLAYVKYELFGSYETLDYCVQYRESDFNFISRLMEKHGIYYYFIHEKNNHQLIVTDTNNKHQTVSGYQKIPYFPPENTERRKKDHIFDWVCEHKVCSGIFELNDFDFETPSSDLTAKSLNTGKHLQDDLDVYDYPGEYVLTSEGTKLTDVRVDESQTAYAVIQGSGSAMGLQAGLEFELKDFYIADQNTKHYIVAASYIIEGGELVSGVAGAEHLFQCNFTAINSKQQFRPARKTLVPVIAGTQTAIVVGKSGEEIWTDKYGRVKVQFHWDRVGEDNESSTCWVRVSHPMAGKNWGWVSLPRMGQEVVVSFMEGNPDRPLITGRVYNAEQMPPYALPANQTQSGIKTRSSKSGTADNFNEVRFEDKKGEEELYVHAEKDYNRVVENNETLKVGFEKKDAGDQTVDIYNNRTMTVDQGNDTLTVKTGNRENNIDTGNNTLNVKTGNDTTNVKMGNHSISMDMGKSTIKAMQSITLKVGGNSIKIDQTGITIKGIMVKIEGQATAEVKSPMTTVKGDGMLILKGGITMIN
ncbi:MAG: type VI secretion system tip protein VgrG [Methyloprofundus sp.]|nr:type VI secretion system tip protein VgrG [Methyloprofundus sp.]